MKVQRKKLDFCSQSKIFIVIISKNDRHCVGQNCGYVRHFPNIHGYFLEKYSRDSYYDSILYILY